MIEVDHERRFGGLRRLYGVEPAQRIFDSHVMVVGLGGVGSWCVEALARSGVHRLTLVDMDHVAESNINRQIQATSDTLGMAKGEALRQRIALINPACDVRFIDDFVSPENWASILEQCQETPDAVIDACDQVKAKTCMAAWAAKTGVPFVAVGAAGGKRLAHRVDMADISEVTHDPLMASLRYQLRRQYGFARAGKMGVMCVFSKESVAPADASCQMEGNVDGTLNCHGYGSSVAVTSAFGMSAAGWVMDVLASGKARSKKTSKNFAPLHKIGKMTL